MIRRALPCLALAAALIAPAAPTANAAAPAPAWTLTMAPMPSNFAPGKTAEYLASATNVGGAEAKGQSTVQITVPSGLEALQVGAANSDPAATAPPTCGAPAALITCTTEEEVHPGRLLTVTVLVKVLAGEGEQRTASASVEGGGAATGASVSVPTQISAEALPFDLTPGFAAPASNADGSAAVLAGSHPYQLTVDLGFPIQGLEGELTNAGHPRDVRIDLPRGLLGDPAATPMLCTEAELTSESCPEGSAVGLLDLTTVVIDPEVPTNTLYNMVPPPGAAAELAFNAAGVGIFIHLLAHVRTDSDYGAYAESNDLLADPIHPVFNTQGQLWGDPSAAAHDRIRGEHCLVFDDECPVEPRQETPFLTMPVQCSADPLRHEAHADSWEEPGVFHQAGYDSADLQGNPAPIEDCAAIQFEPTIEARPTTNVTDSPSGLDFDLHQPQQEPQPEPLSGRASGILKDTTVAFPPGLAVNASQAAGLGACSEAQIGLLGTQGGVPRFSKAPQSCPDAAKIGTLQATTPLLAQYDEEHEVLRDPETGAPIPRALHGTVYLAAPYANPFGSLLAAYFVIEDKKAGIVAKLAGEGELDAATGQLTVRVKESPELPVKDIGVHAFGGNRGAFTTPPTCAAQQTSALLTPWSAPQAPSAAVSDAFALSAAPGGGPCPATESAMPFAPVLHAGTAQPSAGKYSPLTVKLSRPDGSQRLARVQMTLPEGLIASIAGVAQCPQSGIDRAIAREAPNQGAAEQADPSCPASSQVGTVSVGVGSGPTPYYASGRLYLAGPYKGAPLSFVVIAPAVAGPFDLGTVVNRTAVYLEPETAQVRALTDPLPQLIQGVPVDLRSALIHVDRPHFALNPTSCDEKQFAGTATSALGQSAPLAQRFQVGGCKSLPYKPRFHARLFGPTHRGAHPSLRAVFTQKPGEANTARASFALPRTEFIDQAHFRTICTRVQFAARACPAGSVYGHVKAISPLLDSPLRGPVYLRSSSHQLPDLIAVLRGPAQTPIEVDLVGRIDSVGGGIRTTFAAVPDAPVSKVIVTTQGAKKGLFQNSTNICTHSLPATLKLDAQNGKSYDTHPKLRASCPKRARATRGGGR